MSAPDAAERTARRPRPGITPDNRFFWEGVERGELRIQRCACGRLRHPPGPMCPDCHSLDWDHLEASGRGTLYSWVVAHHPPLACFPQPNLIALVQLEEGTRVVANLVDVPVERVEIGMPLRASFRELEPGRLFLQFQPA